MDDAKQLSVGREIVTALIGLAILAAAVYMLVCTFNSGAKSFGDEVTPAAHALAAAYTRQKDLLLYALSLLGTVTGYYLGRVPAERAADRAVGEAQQAKQRSANIASAAQSVVSTSRDVVEQRRATLGSRGEESEPQSMREYKTAVDRLEQEILK
jgi:hypothetical protein